MKCIAYSTICGVVRSSLRSAVEGRVQAARRKAAVCRNNFLNARMMRAYDALIWTRDRVHVGIVADNWKRLEQAHLIDSIRAERVSARY